MKSAQRPGSASRKHRTGDWSWRCLWWIRKGRAGYKAVHKALAKQSATLALPLGQISVVGLKAPLYRVLRRLVRTARRAIAGIRLTGNVVDDVLVQDAYIYRSS